MIIHTPLPHTPAPPRRRFKPAIVLAAFFVAGAAVCHAQIYVAAQYDAKAALEGKAGFGVGMTNGVSYLSSPQQHKLHFNTNDWHIADGKLVNITGKHATGLWLEPHNGEYDAATIRAGCLLVRVKSRHSRSTFFASEFSCRLASRLNGSENGVIDSQFTAEKTRVWINQEENMASRPVRLQTNQWALVSFVIPSEISLNGRPPGTAPGADSRVVLLGDGNPLEWGRAMDAEIVAATLLGGNAEDFEFEWVLRGVEHAIARYHGVNGVAKPVTADIRNTTYAANFKAFGVWGTLLLVR